MRGKLLAAAGAAAVVLSFLLPAAAQAGWTKSTRVVPGRWADADVFRLPDGRYRMLYGTESEVAGSRAGMYSSISTDGKKWTPEGRALPDRWLSGPDVVELPGGGWRVYLNGPTEHGPGVISYTSTDGKTWTREEGERLPFSWLRKGENFGFTSTRRLANGTWVMAYNVDLGGSYKPGVPTGRARIHWATSTDGLTWTKRGVAVSANNDKLFGNARSPEFFGNQLYFWSFKGIFRVTFTGSGFAKRTKLELPSCKVPGAEFPWSPPPSDPALARIAGKTVLFHGDHTRGIHRTVKKAGAHSCFRGHI